MAEIQFQQVALPNFSTVNALAAQAGKSYQDAFKNLQDTLKGVQTGIRDQNTARLMDHLNSARTVAEFDSPEFQNTLASMKAGFNGEIHNDKYQQLVQSLPDRLNQRELAGLRLTEARDHVNEAGTRNEVAQKLLANDYAGAAALMQGMRSDVTPYVTLADQLRNSEMNRQNISHSMTMDNKRFGLQERQFGLQQDEFEWKKNQANQDAMVRQWALRQLGYGASDGGTYTPSATGGVIPPDVRAGIIKGESNGDYDALLGYSNRGKGKFSGVKLTDMTVDQAIQFSAPGGEYANWSKGQVGRVATPMGAYQIVGSTLRDMKKRMGLKGNERMTPALQDRIADEIFKTQGLGAWAGYKGPARTGGVAQTRTYQGIPFRNPQPASTGPASLNNLVALSGGDPKAFSLLSGLQKTTDKIASKAKTDELDTLLRNHPVMKNLGNYQGSFSAWADDKSSWWRPSNAGDIVAAINSDEDLKKLPDQYKVALAEGVLAQAEKAEEGLFSTGWWPSEISEQVKLAAKTLNDLRAQRMQAEADVANSTFQSDLALLQLTQQQKALEERQSMLRKLAGL